ncbi:RNA-binding protein [Clostridium polyendosporum]|uniref:RNA-binding protein n=1 Tax=Clostridium polyendosporum TaxID=69208 RepID=A0A919RYI9_9CLOT|nr:S4 domain-containing protein YaaA [Clostridium polyendosporum]GIM28880.1 RNA-binding protein [Clostridium polyendosporum]
MVEIEINTEFIKLDAFLKWCGAVMTGAEAKMYILNEEIIVNGEVCTQRGKKLRVGDTVEFNNEQYRII